MSCVLNGTKHAPEANSYLEAEHVRPLLRRRPEVRNTTVALGLTRKRALDSIRCCDQMAAISTLKRSGHSPRTTPTASSSISAGRTTAAAPIARVADVWSLTMSAVAASDAPSLNAVPSSR